MSHLLNLQGLHGKGMKHLHVLKRGRRAIARCQSITISNHSRSLENQNGIGCHLPMSEIPVARDIQMESDGYTSSGTDGLLGRAAW